MSNVYVEKTTIGKYGRTGVLKTRKGEVQTPTFMPDGTRGAVKGLTPQQVIDTGVEIVLANTYHLHLQPGEKVIKELGGLHKFTNRKGPILTDSGGFQVFSLDKHAKVTEEGVAFKDPNNGNRLVITPETSVQIQLDLGADMIVAFDHLVGLSSHGVSDGEVKDAFDRTHRWLDRCIVEFKRLTKNVAHPPLFFGVVQGGLDIELRKESLRLVQDSDVDGVAIGGLSVGESRKDMTRILEALAPLYDNRRPRFLLGVGTPEDLRIAVENGIDMLDCVLPTRNARHSSIWIGERCGCATNLRQVKLDSASSVTNDKELTKSSTSKSTKQLDIDQSNSEQNTPGGRIIVCNKCRQSYNEIKVNLTNRKFAEDSRVIEEGCDCYTCSEGFSRAFLRHQFKAGDPLAGSLATIHNLRYMMRLCERYR